MSARRDRERTSASSSGRWLPIRSRVPSAKVEPDAAVAAGVEDALAVAAGADAPAAVVGDRPIADDLDGWTVGDRDRSGGRSGPSRTRRGRRSGVTSVVIRSTPTTSTSGSARPTTAPRANSTAQVSQQRGGRRRRWLQPEQARPDQDLEQRRAGRRPASRSSAPRGRRPPRVWKAATRHAQGPPQRCRRSGSVAPATRQTAW